MALEPEPRVRDRDGGAGDRDARRAGAEWIGLCLDCCHLAVAFEDPARTVAALGAAGVPIVKMQVSSALRVADRRRRPAASCSAASTKPRFLHQSACAPAGVQGADDLGEALAGATVPASGEWRVHFHMPVHVAADTTRDELAATLAAVAGGPVPLTRHFEVETCTWSIMRDVAPDDDALVAGLARGWNGLATASSNPRRRWY